MLQKFVDGPSAQTYRIPSEFDKLARSSHSQRPAQSALRTTQSRLREIRLRQEELKAKLRARIRDPSPGPGTYTFDRGTFHSGKKCCSFPKVSRESHRACVGKEGTLPEACGGAGSASWSGDV